MMFWFSPTSNAGRGSGGKYVVVPLPSTGVRAPPDSMLESRPVTCTYQALCMGPVSKRFDRRNSPEVEPLLLGGALASTYCPWPSALVCSSSAVSLPIEYESERNRPASSCQPSPNR